MQAVQPYLQTNEVVGKIQGDNALIARFLLVLNLLPTRGRVTPCIFPLERNAPHSPFDDQQIGEMQGTVLAELV